MKQMLKLASTLAAYTVVACLCLALVYNFTKPYIDAAAQSKTTAALQKVFPEAQSFIQIKDGVPQSNGGVHFKNAFLAVKDSEPLGVTVTASGATFDKATIILAIDTKDTLKAIQFLELTDTPGFGSKAADPPFIDQFTDKPLNSPFALGDDIVAISGATVTSTGVVTIIRAGIEAAQNILQKDLRGIINAAKENK